MSKIFGLTIVFILTGFMAFAQQAEAASSKKCTMSLEKCAAKMGMTVEECRAKCTTTKGTAQADASSATIRTTEAHGGTAAQTGEMAASSKKSCTMSLEKCAAKMGMTVEECRAKCTGKTSEGKHAER